MAITSGSRLGPYEIVAPIGAGGMGEVYKARDTRLDRSVAIKVLPPAFADNAQLKLRFEREAKTISQLTHPHICTLYDVGNDQGVEYLVMELLDGETLADRIARGPLPMRDVLRYGGEIAAALDRAHRGGVVHRDLKPGNVMITKSGAKLLDFGLAKGGAISLSGGSTAYPADGATLQKSLTQEGTILGTFQYMAPEQLEGTDADARTDIFALGTLLYEMASGRRAFSGKTKTSLIAAIVGGEPTPIREIQPLTPPAFEHVIAKCLAKDPDHRWQSASDVASELEWIGATSSQSQAVGDVTRRRSRNRAMVVAMIALAAIAAAAVAAFLFRRPAPADTPLLLSITMPKHGSLDEWGQAILSPDGSSIAFMARTGDTSSSGAASYSLWVRPIDRADPRQLPGTQGASEPFFSPDGRSVGFFAQGKLKRIALAGGPPQTICDAPLSYGAAWSRDGVILFCGQDGPLFRVDANGGTPRPVTHLTAGEEAHRWPVFLPDGDHFLFLGDAPRTENHHVKVGALHDGSSRDLVQAISSVNYVEPGYVLFVRAGSLLAQPIDPKTLTLTGEPRVIAEQVVVNDSNHHFEFSVSQNGRLIYRSGSPNSQLTWVDRFGRTLGTAGDARRLGFGLRLSPDQQRIATDQDDADGRPDDIWVLDVARNVTTRFTFDTAGDYGAAWSPDGSRVAFTSMRAGAGNLFVADASNPSSVRQLTKFKTEQVLADSWTRDGKMIVGELLAKADLDIWLFPAGGGEGKPYLATPFSEQFASVSPDGEWIAYMTDESGRNEIYVERFPSHAERRQVSSSGGGAPMWRNDGREIFYVSHSQLMSVDMTSRTATPKPLFRLPGNSYDVARDGQRFIVDSPLDDNLRSPLTFVSNWMASGK
ncbi:MAG: eukaryotic-like serine/threonine-protein kinase [Thermoanaerobaculia bacterium]|jgi:serine/threonine protein kinase|nr:eukaryotic-like serine/threonine-protein kinase [Thermoanaerobaculia bacterium]